MYPATITSCAAHHAREETRHRAEQLGAVAPHGHRDEGADPDRRGPQDQVNEAPEEPGQVLVRGGEPLACPAPQRHGRDAEEHGEDDQLDHVPVAERAEDVRGDHAEQDVPELGDGAHLARDLFHEPYSVTWAQQGGGAQSQRKRDEVCGQVIPNRLPGESPKGAYVGQRGKARKQVEEDQRHRRQDEQVDEEVTDRLEHGDAFAHHRAQRDTHEHADQDAHAGAGSPAAAGGLCFGRSLAYHEFALGDRMSGPAPRDSCDRAPLTTTPPTLPSAPVPARACPRSR